MGSCAFNDLRDGGDAFQDRSSAGGMTLHHPELRIRQPARLVQDAVGDCDLADIVKQGDVVNVVEFVRLYTEAFSDLSGIVADADGVAVRVFVLGVDGPGNCLERFQRNVLILQLTLQRLFCLRMIRDEIRNTSAPTKARTMAQNHHCSWNCFSFSRWIRTRLDSWPYSSVT